MRDANKWNLSNDKSFIQQLFDTAISFNSVIDLPEVFLRRVTWLQILHSDVSLHWQRRTKYLWQVAGATRVSSDVGVWLVPRYRYAYRLSTMSDVIRF